MAVNARRFCGAISPRRALKYSSKAGADKVSTVNVSVWTHEAGTDYVLTAMVL